MREAGADLDLEDVYSEAVERPLVEDLARSVVMETLQNSAEEALHLEQKQVEVTWFVVEEARHLKQRQKYRTWLDL